MKKHVLITSICLLFLSLGSFAQIKKGSVLLGGGISGGKGKSETNNQESTSTSFSIYPTVGLAVKDNAVVGLRLSYGRSKTTQPDGTNTFKRELDHFGAGVFYRRYLNLSQKFFLFGEGAVYYNKGKQESITPWQNATQDTYTFGANFYPGIAYAVSRRIHLEIGLNNLLDISYSRSKAETVAGTQQNVTESSGVNFSTNVSTSAPLTVGFRFVLGK